MQDSERKWTHCGWRWRGHLHPQESRSTILIVLQDICRGPLLQMAPNGSKWLCLIFILATVLKICQHTFISCPMEIAWGRKLFVFICLSFSVSYAASWQYFLLRINLENRWESKTELALLRIVLVYLWHPYLCISTWTNSFQEMKVNPPWIPL